MSPGATVVDLNIVARHSARIASEKPVSANLLALYGAKMRQGNFAANGGNVDDTSPTPETHLRHNLRNNSYGAQKCSFIARS